MKNLLKNIGLISLAVLAPAAVAFAGTFIVPQGGIGVNTLPASQVLYGNGTSAVGTAATTTVSCSGSTSCTSFTAIGPSPITITSSGGSSGLSTTTPISDSNLTVYSSIGKGEVYGVATTSATINNGLTGTLTTVNSQTQTIGLNTTSLSTNAVVGWNGSNLVATGTPELTVGFLNATGTTATSTFANAVGIGGSLPGTWSNLGYINCILAYPASVSTGGCVHIDSSSANTGPALEVTVSAGASASGRGIVFNQTNTADVQDFMLASSSASNTTVLNLKGEPTGKGIIKCEHTGGGATGYSNASCLSIDTSINDAQGIFIKGGTGIPFQIQNSSSATLHKIDAIGNSTTTGYAEVDGTGTSTFAGGVKTSGNIDSRGASASSTFSNGITLSAGCFAIGSTCVGGSGGTTVTNYFASTSSAGGYIQTATIPVVVNDVLKMWATTIHTGNCTSSTRADAQLAYWNSALPGTTTVDTASNGEFSGATGGSCEASVIGLFTATTTGNVIVSNADGAGTGQTSNYYIMVEKDH